MVKNYQQKKPIQQQGKNTLSMVLKFIADFIITYIFSGAKRRAQLEAIDGINDLSGLRQRQNKFGCKEFK